MLHSSKPEIGQLGEDLATIFLKNKRYKIIERNFRAPRWGEIDIIAQDGDQLVFVEVKTRVGEQMTSPLDAIHSHKIHALKRCAQFYIQQEQKNAASEALRLDAITVELQNLEDKQPIITHYINIEA